MSRSLLSDRRGQSVTIATFIVFLAIVGFLIISFNPVIEKAQNNSEDLREGTEYENYSDTMAERRNAAWNNLPVFAVFLGALFVLAMAVLRSSP